MSLMVLPLEETIGSGDFDPFLIKGLKYPVMNKNSLSDICRDRRGRNRERVSTT